MLAASSSTGLLRTRARQPIWNAPDLLKDYCCDRRRLALSSTLDAYGASCSKVVVHPFEDARFLRAVARTRPMLAG
jgi:phage gp36-like protein